MTFEPVPPPPPFFFFFFFFLKKKILFGTSSSPSLSSFSSLRRSIRINFPFPAIEFEVGNAVHVDLHAEHGYVAPSITICASHNAIPFFVIDCFTDGLREHFRGTLSANDSKGIAVKKRRSNRRIFNCNELNIPAFASKIHAAAETSLSERGARLEHLACFVDIGSADGEASPTRSDPEYKLNRFSRKNPINVEPYSRASSTERLDGAPTAAMKGIPVMIDF